MRAGRLATAEQVDPWERPYLSYLSRYTDWRTVVALVLALTVLPALIFILIGGRNSRSRAEPTSEPRAKRPMTQAQAQAVARRRRAFGAIYEQIAAGLTTKGYRGVREDRRALAKARSGRRHWPGTTRQSWVSAAARFSACWSSIGFCFAELFRP